MPRFVPPQQRPAWQTLSTLAAQPMVPLRALLQHPQRPTDFQAQACGITLDYSRQRVTPAVLAQLLALAEQSDWAGQRDAMFRGDPINRTEGRAVLHVALRGSGWADAPWEGPVSQQVQAELDKVCAFADHARAGGWSGFAGHAITDVVNLGIGGSDLGPRMAHKALADATSRERRLRVHFVSNVDAWQLEQLLAELDPARTAFIVQSKSFTTQETMTLAASAKRWLCDGGCAEQALAKHLVAVTARADLAEVAGFLPAQTFLFWDWVGGRFSVWSAIGLPLALGIGAEAFRAFLRGAHAMDRHFLSTPAERNLPVLMALLGLWNRNFLGAATLNIAPYTAALTHFASFLQQLEMESNGKRTHIDGSPVEIDTAPLLWGGLGINGQHAYFQLIHQGRHLVPLDFIGLRRTESQLPLAQEHHRVVTLNMLAQAQAMALGRDAQETARQLRAEGLDDTQVQQLTPHRTYPGNVPSSVLWMDTLTPDVLGSLVALYEHKVFCQAAIWGIHAFDQWGVELGKSMARALEAADQTKGNP